MPFTCIVHVSYNKFDNEFKLIKVFYIMFQTQERVVHHIPKHLR